MDKTGNKVVVITGSTKGLGLELAKGFRKNGFSVVINGRNEKRLLEAEKKIEKEPGKGEILAVAGDVSRSEDIHKLLDTAVERFGHIDIWINNAGANQPYKTLWELSEDEIDEILSVDLRSAILGTRLATLQMEKQPDGGMIYNLEGHGSNDAMILGLSMYGTTKRALTYYTQAFAKELKERGSKVKIGRLSPGIMLTDFTTQALGGKESIELSEKTKKVYSILGDRPEVVAEFFMKKILGNTKNDVHFQWLTNRKAAFRFMTAAWRKKK